MWREIFEDMDLPEDWKYQGEDVGSYKVYKMKFGHMVKGKEVNDNS